MADNWITSWNNINQLTVEEKQTLTTQHMKEMITALFEQMLSVYNNGISLVNNNPYGLTAAEVAQGFGENEAELLRLAILLKDCINIAVPGTIQDGPDPYNPLSLVKVSKFKRN